MRRSSFVAVAATAALVLSAAPASAHANFTEKTTPKGSEEVLELYVPVEESGHNAKVTVRVPGQFGALYCFADTGWSCAAEAPAGDAPATFTFTRTSAPPTTEDYFSFAVQTPKKAGSYGFAVTQEYSTGSVVEWDDPAGSGFPAAYITVK